MTLLLVAEAPPEELDRYFYFPDVREHDSLFRYVARGILSKDPRRDEKEALLAELRDRGIFLIDLKPDPIVESDQSNLEDYVPTLVDRASELAPEKIFLIKVNVYDLAYRPLADAGLPVAPERIPFPGTGQQKRFEEAFARALNW